MGFSSPVTRSGSPEDGSFPVPFKKSPGEAIDRRVRSNNPRRHEPPLHAPHFLKPSTVTSHLIVARHSGSQRNPSSARDTNVTPAATTTQVRARGPVTVSRGRLTTVRRTKYAFRSRYVCVVAIAVINYYYYCVGDDKRRKNARSPLLRLVSRCGNTRRTVERKSRRARAHTQGRA